MTKDNRSYLRCKLDAELCEVFARRIQIVTYDRQVGLEMTNDGVDIWTLVSNRFHILP